MDTKDQLATPTSFRMVMTVAVVSAASLLASPSHAETITPLLEAKAPIAIDGGIPSPAAGAEVALRASGADDAVAAPVAHESFSGSRPAGAAIGELPGIPVTAVESGWALGGYGESFVTTRFFGPDPNRDYSGSSYRQTDVDLARVVFMARRDFASWLSFSSEVEIEHGGTGVTREVEWEEFGEYEQEVEKGGEIVLEQAYLEARAGRERGWPFEAALRVGHLLVPIGMISYYHLPTMFIALGRPESEERLLPSTWHETGAEVALGYGGLSLQIQVITGLDSTGFSSSRWIAGGTQRAFEVARANDWALAGRLDWHGTRGLLVGGSVYTGNTNGNRPKRDMDGVKAQVLIGDLHVRFRRGPLRINGEIIAGRLGAADRVTAQNATLSDALGAPRTPVGSAAYGYYIEAGLDLLGLRSPQAHQRLDVFFRHDGYDTMWAPPAKGSGFDNPLLEARVLSAGLGYYPHPRVVLKGEYLSRWINKDDRWNRRQQEARFTLGFVL